MEIERELPDLIRAHIPSVWALELILLFRRTRDRAWRATELSDELRATVSIVTSCADHFERIGMTIKDGQDRYRYSTASPVMEAFAAALEAEYRARPVAVVNLIAAPRDNVQNLADAFRFKGKER